MFNWKKHCFICLSLLSFPLLSTFIQQPVDAYTVTTPATSPTEGTTIKNWKTSQQIQHGYLRDNPAQADVDCWEVWCFAGSTDEELTWKMKFSPSKEVRFDTLPAPASPNNPESYGDLYALPSARVVVAVGGWLRSQLDGNFRFLTIDLADFTNLQAVGRNAFENLEHQQEVATVTEITVPDKCSQIEEYAWKKCTFLKKVTFLCTNITYLTPLAFDGCYDTLEEVRIAAGEWTEETLRPAINTLKGTMFQYVGSGDPLSWKENDRISFKNVDNVNKVPDFVATFEGHGFSWTIEDDEDGERFIVLRKSSPMPPPSIDIAEKENVLKENLVYSSKEISVLRDDIVVKDPEGNDLDPNDYDIYLRWVKDEETSEWVKYVDKDSLKVRDAGTYTIQYVVRYKGANENLKSNPEGLNVTDDESGINVTINGE